MTRAQTPAPLRVIMSGGFTGAYERLLPDFEKESGLQVSTGSGASQGSGPQTIGAQLARGVGADMVILSREGLTELIAAGRIAAGSDRDLARVPLGVAVRRGAPKPEVGSVDAFRDTVLKAGTVAMPGSTSGIFLKTELLPRLGLADKVTMKMTPRGREATAMVAAGDAPIAVMPVSEILADPGVELAGVLPDQIQLFQTFAAAVVAGSTQPAAAAKLIDYLASSRSAAAIRLSGMEPLAR